MDSRFVVETQLKKYKRMNGYQCNGHSAMSVLYHLRMKFQDYYSESELLNA